MKVVNNEQGALKQSARILRSLSVIHIKLMSRQLFAGVSDHLQIRYTDVASFSDLFLLVLLTLPNVWTNQRLNSADRMSCHLLP